MYIPTIGLEIHVELKTHTKMFCGCKNDPYETRPNTNVCPICLAHPGVLPTMNEEAIKSVVKVGYALESKIADHSHFDRKSYFYPDLPKGYQISQYEEPLVEGGMLKGVRITRVHLEEDTGTLGHDKEGMSLVDYNRAGVPLMELVTEPDIHTPEEAVAFGKALQRILRYLGVSDANMEQGQMRVEANISVRKEEGEGFGTKVEVKNLNSFRAVEGAIRYELKRQEEALERGEKVVQETRGWDEKKQITISQRSKESAHDYRYFPEPDLPPLDLTKWNREEIKNLLPELPEAKYHRFINEFGCTPAQAEILTEDKSVADYFENAVSEFQEKKENASCSTLINYYLNDLLGLLKEKKITISESKITPEHFAHFVALIDEGKLLSRLAKDLLKQMADTGEDPETLLEQSGVQVIGDENTLKLIVEEIIGVHPKVVEDYKKGKTSALQFLVGQGMAKTKGQADPSVLRALFEKLLTD